MSVDAVREPPSKKAKLDEPSESTEVRSVGNPNQTIYIKNLNDKIRKDGKSEIKDTERPVC